MTESILDRIAREKRKEVGAAKIKRPLNDLKAMTANLPPQRPFFERMRDVSQDSVNIIAEIKRASPSAGPIRLKLDAAKWAATYETGGASAISVLTDTPSFQGHPDDLKAAKNATALPILRKDFIVSSYQIYESAVMGADAVLLIVRILSPSQLTEYHHLAQSIGLDALVEIHTNDDLDLAQQAGAHLIGINNRDLASFHTDTNRAIQLVDKLTPNQLPVAASGIHSRDHIIAGVGAGIQNFLVGEHLVRSDDPVAGLNDLRGVTPQ